MDIPIWRHFSNRHDRQMIFDVETISHRLFSEQKYRSGAFSLIDRRKNPSKTQIVFTRQIQSSSLTLHASHVTAPKWIPDAEAPQTRQGSFLYKSSLFRSVTSIDWFVQLKRQEEKTVTGDLHADGETFSQSTILTLSSTSFGDQTAQIFLTLIFLLSVDFHRDRT